MNRAYRLIWNAAKEAWVVAAELVKGKGRAPAGTGRPLPAADRSGMSRMDNPASAAAPFSSLMMALEPRFVFDAAGAATAAAVADGSHDAAVPDKNAEQARHHERSGDHSGREQHDGRDNFSSDILKALGHNRVHGDRSAQDRDEQAHSVLFIDPRVPDVPSLAAGVRPGVEIVFLDPNQDGVTQISGYLQSHTSISSVHIFSHGASGSILIGTTNLDAGTISGRSAEISAWSASLTADADILLYGCDVAAGSQGLGFIGKLAEATGADVAASTDPTGATAKGGNWVLETATGTIEARSPLTRAAMAGYGALMDGPTITSILRQTPTYDTTNADSVTFRVTFTEAVKNVDGTDFTIAPGSVSGATIQLVTPVTGSNGTQYDVIVGGLSGSGSLNLDLYSGNNIKSVAGDTPLVYANQAGGNTATDQTYTVDRSITAPAITGLKNAANGQGDTGVSGSDFVTSTQNLKFTGTTDAGNTVQVFLGGQSIGSTTADGSGNWTLDYTGTTLGEGTYSLTATAGDNAGNSATSAPVALVIDRTAPTISSASASDIIVTLTYTESTSLDAINTAVPGAFTVKANGTDIAVNSVAVNATNNTVMLTLNSAIGSGQTVTVSYTDPTAGNDVNAIQDKAGNDAATQTNVPVTNNTSGSNVAPVIGNVSGNTWYSKGDPAVAVFSGTPTLTDVDDTHLEQATVSITTNRNSNDVLSIAGTLPDGITAAYDSGTGVLTLTGHATKADYQTALALVRFQTSAGLDASRTITLKVNDGQVDSASATRTMRVLGPAFALGETASAYLVGNTTGNSSLMELTGVNLVMGTTTTLVTDFNQSLNAMGFNPIDGHLYAWDDASANSTNSNGAARIVRINSDNTVTYLSQPALGSSASGNQPASGAAPKAADIGPDGIMYISTSGKIYRFDVDPRSSTYLTWLTPLNTVSGTLADLAFHPGDGYIYAVTSSTNIYKINPADGTYTSITYSGGPTGSPLWGQYFDSAGFLYVTAGGSNAVIYRIDLTNPANPTKTVTTIPTGNTLPTAGDGGRVVTINLDFGDAPDSYKTQLSNNGARHNLLGNKTWLGSAPDNESNATPGAAADSDGADEDGILSFSDLRLGTTSYSVDVQVSNLGSSPTTLVGWIDFDKDGQFDTREAASATIPAGTTNGTVTLTWNNIQGMIATGDTYARFRIASGLATAGTDGAGTGANSQDTRSYGPMMDGEVEDYKITIQAADATPPTVDIVSIASPRHTPVGTVTITFDKAVTGVDITDFTLTRDGVAISLAGLTVNGSGANYTIDLSGVTSPQGNYVLSIDPTGSGIKAANNVNLASGDSISFTIDTTAPVIDLDPSDAATRNHATASVNGAVVSLDDNSDPATLVEAGGVITQIKLQVGGLRDGAGEKLIFGATEIRADGNSGAQAGLTIGTVANIDIAYADGVFTLTKNGGTLSADDAQKIIRDIQYRNSADINATTGDRTFSFTATDLAGVTATPAVATIAVSGSGTAGPLTPTVDPLHTNDTTPVITGTATVGAGDTLTVQVNNVTYTNGDGNLTYNPATYTWSLTIPDNQALTERIYPVTATVTNISGSSTDLTNNELIIDLTAPAAPTVVSQATTDTTPTITGTANLATNEYLTVTVNGVTYTEGDGSLTRIGPNWSLTIPNALADGTYPVIATAHDPAGNFRDDTTSNELIIDTTKPAAPALDLTDASDSGVSQTDDTTNDTTPTIRVTLNGTGAAAPVAGDVVKLYENGTQVGSATLTGTDITNNYVDITTSLLTPGTKSFTSTVTDAAGNVSDTSPELPVLIDTTAPVFSTATIDGTTLVLTYTENGGSGFAGTTPATTDFTVTKGGSGVGVTGVVVDAAHNTVTITLAAAVIHADTVKVSYTAGTNKIQDVAGNNAANLVNQTVTNNTSDVPTQTVVITSATDDVAPQTGAVANGGSTNDTAPDLSGTLSAVLHSGEVLAVYRDGVKVGEATVNGTTWTYADTGLVDGTTYSYTAQVESIAGHGTVSNTYAIAVDTTPPEISVASITSDTGASASDFITNDRTLVISGTFNHNDTNVLTVDFKGHTYTVGDGHLTTSGDSWSLDVQDISLPDGTYTVVAKAYDVAGNLAQDSQDIVIDTVAPTTGSGATDVNVVSITSDTGASASDFITSDRTLVISGTFNHNDTNVLTVDFKGHTYTVGDGHLTTSGDSWSLDVQDITLTDGTYTVIAKAYDVAGNLAQDSQDI
ncbi:Ig-like domain-containing protein, partial [Geobacter sp. SVR]|uniref:Ig-like domain-containing protein n=1 Tax=Geobacter sp. SVR TaxID=2495594 RepID=UPI00156683F6